jgi:hypothetical protein
VVTTDGEVVDLEISADGRAFFLPKSIVGFADAPFIQTDEMRMSGSEAARADIFARSRGARGFDRWREGNCSPRHRGLGLRGLPRWRNFRRFAVRESRRFPRRRNRSADRWEGGLSSAHKSPRNCVSRGHSSDANLPRFSPIFAQSVERDFLLFDDATTTDLYVFLPNFVYLEHCPGKPRAFLIRPKRSPARPQGPSLASYRRPIANPLPAVRTIPEPFRSHLFLDALPTLPSTTVCADNIDSLFPNGVRQSSLPIYRLDIPDGFRFDLWLHLLKVGQTPRAKSDFVNLHECWRVISREQWRRNAALRRFVQRSETDISERQMGDRGPLAFAVLMSCMFPLR